VTEYREIVKIAETITEGVMIQYEEVRAGGECNMWDQRCVREVADANDYHALASLTGDEYVLCIKHYEDLMHIHDLERQ